MKELQNIPFPRPFYIYIDIINHVRESQSYLKAYL